MRYTVNGKELISRLTLERYYLGDLSAEEKTAVEAEFAVNEKLRLYYAELKKELEAADRDAQRLYPTIESLPKLAAFLKNPVEIPKSDHRPTPKTTRSSLNRPRKKTLLWAVPVAAAAVILIIFSVNYLASIRSPTALAAAPENAQIRARGTETKTELSIYLKEMSDTLSPEEAGIRLRDQTLLKEGDTVQLAYTTPPAKAYYGVIFSIDGRSAVTLHYPYTMQETPVLTTGKLTRLKRVYTLDDAPDYEMFFMVVSQNPLDTERIYKTAKELAHSLGSADNSQTAAAKGAAAFEGCEVETITIKK